MFGQFLNIVVRSIKLDKSLYRDNKYFGEAGLYFAGMVMGIAKAKGIGLRWGGDWNQNTELKDNGFDDLPHFEIRD